MKNTKKITDDDYLLKKQLEKMQEILQLKESIEPLVELNFHLFSRLIMLYRKNNISLDPETKAMISMVRKQFQIPLDVKSYFKPAHDIQHKENFDSDHDNSTVPNYN